MNSRLAQRGAAVLFIWIPSALAYLVLAPQFGFYTDDWYSIYGAVTKGPGIFWQIFSFDRPARAILMIPLYQLFGPRAPLYSYSGYAVRLAGALAFYWILTQIVPGRRGLAAVTSALYLLYPGFLEQPKAFDFQSHLWSVSFALASMACSLKACQAGLRRWRGALWLLLSLPLTFFYLSQMEYFIGLEVLRLGLVGWVVLRGEALPWRVKLRRVLPAWVLQALPALLFLGWRVLFFKSLRSDTDITRMLAGLVSSPLQAGWMLVHLGQDSFNALLGAWVLPLYDLTMPMRLRDLLAVFGVGTASALLAGLLLWPLLRSGESPADRSLSRSLFLLGLAAVLAALLPSALGGRRVEFLTFTRYTLPVAPGAALMAAGILAGLENQRTVWIGAALAVGLATTIHFSNALVHVQEWQTARNFWWQAAWRIPELKAGTTLIAYYPRNGVALDYITWGPANLIFTTPTGQGKANLLPVTASSAQDPDTYTNLVLKNQTGSAEKGFVGVKDFKQALVMWMPDAGCLKVMDGKNPEYSENMASAALLYGPYSKLEQIDPRAPAAVPPEVIFGPEPKHTWCYYYEKASLARQRGDWAEAARLGDQALKKGADTTDWVELLPFIQAYASQGDQKNVDFLASLITFKPWVREQACQTFARTSIPNAAWQTYLENKICH